jgi:small-conductance mechanosensitive channel
MTEWPQVEGLRRPVGVWRAVIALGDYPLKQALWPEAILALVIGGGGSVFIVRATTASERVGAASDVLVLAAALLGVVFAALAIVVSLPSTSYLRMLGETEDGGMRKFLDPFLVAVGTQIVLLLLAFAYSLAAEAVPWWVEHAAFYVMATVLVLGLLDIAGLARQLVRHGVLRAADAAVSEEEQRRAGDVHRLSERRGGSQG